MSMLGGSKSTGSTAGTTSGVYALGTSIQDSNRMSPFAQMLSELQQLQQTDPSKYQQVTQQISTNLTTAANTATSEGNTAAATQLNQLAADFSNASTSGQLANVQDLAQAVGGHHRDGRCLPGSERRRREKRRGGRQETGARNAKTRQAGRGRSGARQRRRKEAWTQHVAYAKDVESYTEYALYATAVQSPPEQLIELIAMLEQQAPKSKYLADAYGPYFAALNASGASAKITAIAEKALENLPDNEDALAVVARSAYDRKQMDRALTLANRLVAAASKHAKPENVPQADFERKRSSFLGQGYWMAGIIYGDRQQFALSDKALRAALPLIKGNNAMAGPALFLLGVDMGVLGVDVEDGVAEHADGLDRIDALPEHVAGIVVASHGGARDRAQLEQGLRAVGDEAGVHLDGDLARRDRPRTGRASSSRGHLFVPLPLQDFEILRRPRAGDPVGIFGGVARRGSRRNRSPRARRASRPAAPSCG